MILLSIFVFVLMPKSMSSKDHAICFGNYAFVLFLDYDLVFQQDWLFVGAVDDDRSLDTPFYIDGSADDSPNVSRP